MASGLAALLPAPTYTNRCPVFGSIGDLVRAQLILHGLEARWQRVAVVHGPGARGQADLLEIVDGADALRLGLGPAQGRQQHRRQDRHDGQHDQHRQQALGAAPHRRHDQHQHQPDDDAEEDHAEVVLDEVAVELDELLPGVAQVVGRAARHGHVAVEAAQALRDRHEELPLGVGVRDVGDRRRQSNAAGEERRLQVDLVCA